MLYFLKCFTESNEETIKLFGFYATKKKKKEKKNLYFNLFLGGFAGYMIQVISSSGLEILFHSFLTHIVADKKSALSLIATSLKVILVCFKDYFL